MRSGEACCPIRTYAVCILQKADEDVLVTANGRQRLDIIGDPYHERVIYRRERIMDMRWKDTPEPPDVAYAIPEARKFLRRGKFEEAAKVMDKATKDAGYDKWIDSRPFGVEFPRLHPRLHSVIELLTETRREKIRTTISGILT